MISTHILDTSVGKPAEGVAVKLEKKNGADWKLVSQGATNADGRFAFDCPYELGDYRITFAVEDYYKGKESFFLDTPVIFRVKSTERKYHVPLLINPFGLSTYRGS